MAKLTRRGLIKGASIGVGTTGVLAAAVATGAHFASPTSASAHSAQPTLGGNSNDPLVVCVNDAASGNLVLMRGEREITIHDPSLVRSLLSL
ncbi:MAG TPA: hypothetical protein VGD98_09635 [Ktedonobacteraceae bacterium]